MKAKAVIEVVVVFALAWSILALVGLSPLGAWERQITGRDFFIEYIAILHGLPQAISAAFGF